jgi:hypothetical protein
MSIATLNSRRARNRAHLTIDGDAGWEACATSGKTSEAPSIGRCILHNPYRVNPSRLHPPFPK